MAVAGLDALAHQRGNDMAGFKIEVVTGSVEVRRQQKDRVEAELASIGLSLDEEHLFGKTVCRVGFLRIAVPEVRFVKRDRGQLRIGAHATDGDEFCDIAACRGIEQLDAHE